MKRTGKDIIKELQDRRDDLPDRGGVRRDRRNGRHRLLELLVARLADRGLVRDRGVREPARVGHAREVGERHVDDLELERPHDRRHRADAAEDEARASRIAERREVERKEVVLEEALLQQESLAKFAKVLIVGRTISNNSTQPNLDPVNMRMLWAREASIQCFSRYSYPDKWAFARERMMSLCRNNKITTIDNIIVGFEQTPNALHDMLAGKYTGKVMVRYAEAEE